jgi:ZPR1 zinc-finger domain
MLGKVCLGSPARGRDDGVLLCRILSIAYVCPVSVSCSVGQNVILCCVRRLHELGYEDIDEFEDALKSTFAEFLAVLPHVEITTWEDGRQFFKIKPEPPRESWTPSKMTFTVNNTADLWRACFKSQYARIEIPELEFEISADGKRHIDSIYNHIGSAIYNLGNHVKGAAGMLSDDHANKIMDTVIVLNQFLDVPKPFTWIVHDPAGLSDMKPLEGITVVRGADAVESADAVDGAGEAAAAEQAV